ncbi:60S ribosomal protein L2 [Striga asiatica]|uniref:60S ribosomal protein L2 n=1 Tax=Striga asiatica TaxID=4170 RepID=A0A5A7Q6A2_STRAF|nr:60S ribosomal protein L2 [Striga asiatica]
MEEHRKHILPSSVIIWVVGNNNSVIPRSPSENPSVTHVMLHVADNGTLRDRSEWEDIADHKIGLLAAVDELAGIHALGGHEKLLLMLEPEWVAENNAGERRSAARVVDDLGDHALQVAVALAEVEGPETSRALAVVGVGLEHGSSSLTLCTDNTTHRASCSVCVCVTRGG